MFTHNDGEGVTMMYTKSNVKKILISQVQSDKKPIAIVRRITLVYCCKSSNLIGW